MFRSKLIAACALVTGVMLVGPDAGSARAQDRGMASAPPNILVIQREFTKPGREGTMHEKTEKAYIQAVEANKSKTRYFAMTSLSGRGRALFFSGYNSLAAWEQEQKENAANSALTSSLDTANVADGDLLESSEQSFWAYRPDMSFNIGEGLKGARYMEITDLTIRPGHRQEFEQTAKMIMDAAKSTPGEGWAMFAQIYGGPGTHVLLISALKSMSEADAKQGFGKKLMAALGADGMKQMTSMESSSVESVTTNLFRFSPAMSYPPDGMVQSDPDFWKHPGGQQ